MSRFDPADPGRRLTVGIIGGLGPQATVDLFRRIVDATPVSREADHLHILIDNRPDMPDRRAAIAGRGPSPVPDLVIAAQTLERAGADFLVLASNTPHYFAPEIRAAVSIPFLDMIEACCDRLIERHPTIRVAGLLAATGCVQAGLYHAALARRDVQVVTPLGAADRRLQAAICAVKLNAADDAARAAVAALAATLVADGAEAVIAGCTEVPMLLDSSKIDVPLIDATQILAEAVVATAISRRDISTASIRENQVA